MLAINVLLDVMNEYTTVLEMQPILKVCVLHENIVLGSDVCGGGANSHLKRKFKFYIRMQVSRMRTACSSSRPGGLH